VKFVNLRRSTHTSPPILTKLSRDIKMEVIE